MLLLGSCLAKGGCLGVISALKQSPTKGISQCLGCSAVEALGEKLKEGWGSAGTRVLAEDLIRSCVRQVRGLRRLGIAGAGKTSLAQVVRGHLARRHLRHRRLHPQHPCWPQGPGG